jgi:ribosome biogenesis GTPase / thiamine phosphate phosphatase
VAKAIIYKSTGSWYVVKNEQGEVYNARIKGKFKIDEDITSSNPIAVGDEVEIEMENELEGSVTITQIFPRKNYIIRQSPSNKRQKHIIAANIDQSLLFATLKEPRTSTGFIDRFLITCEAYHVPAIIVFNKIDVYKKKEEDKLEEVTRVYQSTGYKVHAMSLQTGEGVEEIKQLLKNKTTLLSGHSGVGKSTFINAIFPQFGLKTQEVSGWSGKGLHTTTFAEMYDLPFGGRIIDTPGVREFGLFDFSKQELSHYFPEMKELIQHCQFNNCMHMNEPGCAVKNAVEHSKIHWERYVNYCNILDTVEENQY